MTQSLSHFPLITFSTISLICILQLLSVKSFFTIKVFHHICNICPRHIFNFLAQRLDITLVYKVVCLWFWNFRKLFWRFLWCLRTRTCVKLFFLWVILLTMSHWIFHAECLLLSWDACVCRLTTQWQIIGEVWFLLLGNKLIFDS